MNVMKLERPYWITPTVVRLMSILKDGGVDARFVGGCIRNSILREPINDVDIAVNKSPEDVMKILGNSEITVIPTGIQHGTITAIIDSESFELTTLRRDVETDGRHAEVKFTDSWREDAERRDFTVNALYMDMDGCVYDYFTGIEDCMNRKIQFIGNAADRISEDYLRILRFFRFTARYSKSIDGASLTACSNAKDKLSSLSAERIYKELSGIASASSPQKVIRYLVNYGFLEYWLPECVRDSYMPFNGNSDPFRKFAGIVDTGADSDIISNRLKLTNEQRRRLKFILEHRNTGLWDNKSWSKMIYKNGKDLFMDFIYCYEYSSVDLVARAETFATAMDIPVMPINGNDLITLGVQPGPNMGKLLKKLANIWVASDFMKNRDQMMVIAKALI